MRTHQLFVLIALLLVTTSSVLAFDTLGLSKVAFQSNDADVGGDAWLLTVVENGNNQYATGTFTPDEITRKDGAMAKNDIKIEITDSKNQCQYDLTNSYQKIHSVELLTNKNGGIGFWSAENDCIAASNGAGYILNRNAQSALAICYIFKQQGTYTPLSTPTNTIESTITATVAGQSVSGTINSQSASNIQLGNRAYASWSGNLVSGTQCPNPLDSGVSAVTLNGNPRITSKSGYDEYLPARAALVACAAGVSGQTFISEADYKPCTDAYMAKYAAAARPTTIQPFASALNGDGKVIFDSKQLLQFPVFTLRVRADWLGIYLPVGMPKIVSVTSSAFNEASVGHILATVQNTGDAQASFTISATCKDTALQTGTTQTVTLNAKDQTVVDIPISGGVKGTDTSTTCTVLAQDRNKATNKDTKDVTVTVKALAVCQAGDKQCINNLIQTCNAQGTQWVNTETCAAGCDYSKGAPICNDDTVCTSDAQCDDKDATTKDTCVGVGTKHCKHEYQQGFFSVYGKILLWALMALVFGITATLLGMNSSPWWYTLHAFTAVGILGVILGLFALVSTLAAWLFTIGLILVLLGIATFQWIPGVGISGLLIGIVAIIFSIMVVVTCQGGSAILSFLQVCS